MLPGGYNRQTDPVTSLRVRKMNSLPFPLRPEVTTTQFTQRRGKSLRGKNLENSGKQVSLAAQAVKESRHNQGQMTTGILTSQFSCMLRIGGWQDYNTRLGENSLWSPGVT